eukprot:g9797.t1
MGRAKASAKAGKQSVGKEKEEPNWKKDRNPNPQTPGTHADQRMRSPDFNKPKRTGSGIDSLKGAKHWHKLEHKIPLNFAHHAVQGKVQPAKCTSIITTTPLCLTFTAEVAGWPRTDRLIIGEGHWLLGNAESCEEIMDYSGAQAENWDTALPRACRRTEELKQRSDTHVMGAFFATVNGVSDNIGVLQYLMYYRTAEQVDMKHVASVMGQSPGGVSESDIIQKKMVAYAKLAQKESGGDNVFQNSALFNQVSRMVIQDGSGTSLLQLMDGNPDEDDDAEISGAPDKLSDADLISLLESGRLRTALTKMVKDNGNDMCLKVKKCLDIAQTSIANAASQHQCGGLFGPGSPSESNEDLAPKNAPKGNQAAAAAVPSSSATVSAPTTMLEILPTDSEEMKLMKLKFAMQERAHQAKLESLEKEKELLQMEKQDESKPVIRVGSSLATETSGGGVRVNPALQSYGHAEISIVETRSQKSKRLSQSKTGHGAGLSQEQVDAAGDALMRAYQNIGAVLGGGSDDFGEAAGGLGDSGEADGGLGDSGEGLSNAISTSKKTGENKTPTKSMKKEVPAGFAAAKKAQGKNATKKQTASKTDKNKSQSTHQEPAGVETSKQGAESDSDDDFLAKLAEKKSAVLKPAETSTENADVGAGGAEVVDIGAEPMPRKRSSVVVQDEVDGDGAVLNRDEDGGPPMKYNKVYDPQAGEVVEELEPEDVAAVHARFEHDQDQDEDCVPDPHADAKARAE